MDKTVYDVLLPKEVKTLGLLKRRLERARTQEEVYYYERKIRKLLNRALTREAGRLDIGSAG